MPYIKVNTNGLSEMQGVVADTRRQIDSVRSSFNSTGNALDWDIRISSDINRTISLINNELNNEMDCLRKMENFFNLAISRYNETSNSGSPIKANHNLPPILQGAKWKLPGASKLILKIMRNRLEFVPKAFSFNESYDRFPDSLKSIAKEFGIVGGIYKNIDGSYNTLKYIREGRFEKAIESYIGVGKGTYKVVCTIEKKIANMKKAKPLLDSGTRAENWKRAIWGLDDYFDAKTVGKASRASSATTRVYNNFQKSLQYELGNIKKTDIALSLIGNALDNCEEVRLGEINVARGIAETVGETVVELSVDAVLTAGVAAVVGAAATAIVGTTIAAPAVLVGAGVVLAKIGLDKIASVATGGEKDFTEWISDGLLDFGAYIGGEISKKISNSNIVQRVRSGETIISAVRNSYMDKVNNKKENIKNFFGNVKLCAVGTISRLQLAF